MTVGLARLTATLSAALLTIALAGCAVYRAQPLETAATALEAPSRAMIAGQAAALKHPRLAPVTLDFTRPLTPEALGVIAVISNPDLKAARAKAKVADAQVFDAGLLPDPQLNFGYDGILSGPDTFSAWTAAVAYEVNALRTRQVRRAAERAAQAQVRLDLAWDEWTTAGQARLLGARIAGLERVERFNQQARAVTQDYLARVLAAAAHGDLKADDVEARRTAAVDAADKLRATERDLATARHDLNTILGLPPETVLAVAAEPESALAAPYDAAALFAQARDQRLDLAALREGYLSQEATLRKAVMDQFPSLQLTVTRARDTTGNQTLGGAGAFTLPVLNRNRGGIAIAKATRAQLRAEYDARLFAARAEIAGLVEQIALDARQRAESLAQVTPLQRLSDATDTAAAQGDLAPAVSIAARQALADKRLALALLDQAMAEQQVTLELATGTLLPEPRP